MIHLGTSGWSYKDWGGKFYPENLKQTNWLGFYAKNFDTVEVNASFYRLPFKNMVKGWKNRTPNDFLLTFKGSQLITHKKKLQEVDDYLQRFFDRIKLSEDKLGVVLWQLPPNLKKNLGLLDNFLNILDSDIKQSIEFRDESWFCSEVYELLEKYNTAFCVVSAPGLPSKIEITADFVYIRWHGKDDWYKYNYSKNELNGWATQIKKLDVDEVYGYFNNDYNAYAPKNCLELNEILKD